MCRQSISLLALLVAGFTATSSIAFVLPAATSSSTATRKLAFVAERRPLVCLSLTETEAETSASTAESAAAAKDPAESKTGGEPKRVLTRERFTIFAGNLPFDTNEEKMKELFAAHGKVEIVNLPRNKLTGQPRGFAFVDMASNAELEAAIKALDGQEFEGRVLRVSKSVPKEQQEKKPERNPDDNAGKIYVGNLPYTATKDSVMKFFSQYAEIVDMYLPMNPDTGEARGFAFVTVKEEDADQTIEKTNGLDFEGRELTVSKPLPPGKKVAKRPPQDQQARGDRTKIYVGNLSFYTVPDTLYQVFEEFGTVHDCYFPEDTETGGSRGFAFITMDKDAAMNAITEIDGCELDGRTIRVNEAQPKGGGSSSRKPREASNSSE